MITLSGEYGEGGGSIVRIALALSLLTEKSFEVDNIRKGRPTSGLKAQHLYCIKGAQQLCDAKVNGVEIGSEYLKFEPSGLKSKNLYLDIGTAGSITLVLQSLLLPSLFVNRPIKIDLIGGTDGAWSPSFDYFNNILLPQLQRFAKIECKLLRRGYYPKGNGKVEIKINPKFRINDFSAFEDFQSHLKQNIKKYNLLEQYNLIQIKGVSHASKNLQQAKVAERQAESSSSILKQKYSVPIRIIAQYQDTESTGSGITLWAIFSRNKEDIDENNPIRIGADSLGEQGKKAEFVGKEAADNLIKEIESKAPVDKHLADQILPFMALIGGSARVSQVTSHCRTNLYTIHQFLGEIFEIDEENKVISTK